MTLSVESKRSVTVVAGVGGSGKSTFALRYLANAPLDLRFIFDPEGEYAQRLEMEPAHDGYTLALSLSRGWVIFDPHSMFAGRVTEAFSFFCEWAFVMSERIPGRKLFVVDEAWKYCKPQSIPEAFALICQTGRKRQLELLVNTQRPHLLNGSLLNEGSEFVCFHLQERAALDRMSEYGFCEDELRSLPDLHFIARTDKGGELRGAITL